MYACSGCGRKLSISNRYCVSCESSTCPECGNSSKGSSEYCNPCNSTRFRDNFVHWTSGDSNLDKLIQDSQLNANSSRDLIEWIDYSNLKNIEPIAHGGFGSVYKAIWKDGPIMKHAWDIDKSEWQRQYNKVIAIKKFRNATHVSPELLSEISISSKLWSAFHNVIIQMYGVTRVPQSAEYAIVTKFRNNGNLREMIKRNYSKLTWEVVFGLFDDICRGLRHVHYEEYYHKDLHNGNVLVDISRNIVSIGYVDLSISDFGLCRPMDQSSTDKTICGVLPFVAPEVLLGREYTRAADIYGIGMMMAEVISGEPPFVDRDYDENLALAICSGQRPYIPEYTPEPFAALMKRCWDPIPTNRPIAWELHEQINEVFLALGSFEHSEYSVSKERQMEIIEEFSKEREDKWKARLAELATNPIPLKKSQNMLTSKRLDYSEYLSQKLTVEDWNKLKLTD